MSHPIHGMIDSTGYRNAHYDTSRNFDPTLTPPCHTEMDVRITTSNKVLQK